MLPLFIFLFFILGIETYSFFGLKASLFSDNKAYIYFHLLSVLIVITGIVLLISTANSSYSTIPLHVNLIFGLAFSFILAKLFVSSIFLFEDILRSFAWLFQSVIKFRMAEWSPRSSFAGYLSIGLSIITLLLINYGVLFGRYQFKTHHVVLQYENLPESFNGFKIAQISDLHLGTFDQMKRVKRGLNQLQKENPDLILFTGDMVNNRAEEASPFIPFFEQLKAPYGKYSVLGNHDYGEYVRWKSKDERTNNLDLLKSIQKEMGFQLLLNEHIVLTKDTDSIYIAGVENWGNPPFPQYGNLNKAIKEIDSEDFTILLSHDPTHWREEVLASPTSIELTLSGHTHGMQFGIEIGKFKWSPVKYKYADWAGLFSQNGRNLYVNRGFGSIGFPGRVGIWPEITIIVLQKKR